MNGWGGAGLISKKLRLIMDNLPIITWIGGIIFITLSNPSLIISNSVWEEKVLLNRKTRYSIKDIRKVIEIADDKEVKNDLKRKILFRKTGFILLILTPVSIIISRLIEG